MAFSLDKTGGPLCIWSEMTCETRLCWSHLIFFFIFGIMRNSRILKMSSTEPQTSHDCLSYIDWKECAVSLTHLCFLNEPSCCSAFSTTHVALSVQKDRWQPVKQGCADCRGANYVIFASWSERVWVAAYLCVMRSVFGLWLVHRNLPHFGTVAFQAKRWKAPRGSRVHRVFRFTTVHLLRHCGQR